MIPDTSSLSIKLKLPKTLKKSEKKGECGFTLKTFISKTLSQCSDRGDGALLELLKKKLKL